MKISLVRDIARSRGMKAGKMDKTELTRALQRKKEIMIALQLRMSTNAISPIVSGAKIV